MGPEERPPLGGEGERVTGGVSGASAWAGEQEPACPFHSHPRVSKMSASWGRGRGETGKLLTRKMLGRGRCRPRLLDSYFGSALAGERPPSGRWERAPGQARARRGSGVGGEGWGPHLSPDLSPGGLVRSALPGHRPLTNPPGCLGVCPLSPLFPAL